MTIFANTSRKAPKGHKLRDKMTKEKRTGQDVAVEILGGAAVALSYTEREIIETLPQDQAQEFIELRKRVLAGMDNCRKEYSIGSFNDEETSLAAEDEVQYE